MTDWIGEVSKFQCDISWISNRVLKKTFRENKKEKMRKKRQGQGADWWHPTTITATLATSQWQRHFLHLLPENMHTLASFACSIIALGLAWLLPYETDFYLCPYLRALWILFLFFFHDWSFDLTLFFLFVLLYIYCVLVIFHGVWKIK